MSAGEATSSPVPSFLEDFGVEMVDIYVGVGAAQKQFHVHKVKLCKEVKYFKEYFQSDRKDAQANIARFPHDSLLECMDIILGWVYTGRLPKLHNKSFDSKANVYDFKKLHSLAEPFHLHALMDQIIDDIRRHQIDKNEFWGYATILSIYSHSSEKCGTRRYAADSLNYILHVLKSEKSRETWPILELQETLEKNNDSHKDFLILQQNIGITPYPRRAPNCDYHCHAKDAECSVEKKPA